MIDAFFMSSHKSVPSSGGLQLYDKERRFLLGVMLKLMFNI